MTGHNRFGKKVGERWYDIRAPLFILLLNRAKFSSHDLTVNIVAGSEQDHSWNKQVFKECCERLNIDFWPQAMRVHTTTFIFKYKESSSMECGIYYGRN